MAIRLVPLLVDNLVTKGIKASVCDNSYTNGESSIPSPATEQPSCSHVDFSFRAAPAGVWVLIFCASKAPELLDTVFLVLRKKPVIVLHWSALSACPAPATRLEAMWVGSGLPGPFSLLALKRPFPKLNDRMPTGVFHASVQC
jgi:hypothetical protein